MGNQPSAVDSLESTAHHQPPRHNKLSKPRIGKHKSCNNSTLSRRLGRLDDRTLKPANNTQQDLSSTRQPPPSPGNSFPLRQSSHLGAPASSLRRHPDCDYRYEEGRDSILLLDSVRTLQRSNTVRPEPQPEELIRRRKRKSGDILLESGSAVQESDPQNYGEAITEK